MDFSLKLHCVAVVSPKARSSAGWHPSDSYFSCFSRFSIIESIIHRVFASVKSFSQQIILKCRFPWAMVQPHLLHQIPLALKPRIRSLLNNPSQNEPFVKDTSPILVHAEGFSCTVTHGFGDLQNEPAWCCFLRSCTSEWFSGASPFHLHSHYSSIISISIIDFFFSLKDTEKK